MTLTDSIVYCNPWLEHNNGTYYEINNTDLYREIVHDKHNTQVKTKNCLFTLLYIVKKIKRHKTVDITCI